MLLAQIVFDNQKTQKQPEKAQQVLKSRQSYAPFMSKSPRFAVSKTESIISFPKITRSNKINDNQRIHIFKTSVQSNQSQFFFKSRIQRFSNQKDIRTPMFYKIAQQEVKDKHKSLTKHRITHIMLPNIKTIPSIPDFRNKFGYNCELQRMSLVQKSQNQLEIERNLMKQYKSSLFQQKFQMKKEQSQEIQLKRANKQLHQRARSILFKQNIQQRTDKREINLVKPKYSHFCKWKSQDYYLQ